ncbi:electron transporter RnfG [Thermosipho melanesiensis]|uniref:Ion-translocating oxidoreductase complex subunit G n=2 Tax=Thermosipho melanesiensis TaxID=46541 RepID=A6LNB6_THEM4|nr:RnfABCDGE type electron transport complex subunit G [Thermosipho melanesiensis]ABR31417.1 electron transport complex, RnfABCDGE type, G subunit [Thermosipho melanesiensis BI429]APT74476.1 electron transporter RnfG [Thermosipho melanesiensis]OOC36436.1 electron transporter RnfG [Thermosipho melanesiensis]OOC37254.1 electron transporter RnfG [Thermosipho melanesiensis]OOC38006.1 electron transporter RnfG [Thermosipho melanesiensis]
MKETIKTGIILMVYTLVAGMILGFVYLSTQDAIKVAELKNTIEAVKFVLTEDGKLLVKESKIKKAVVDATGEEKELYIKDTSAVLSPVLNFDTEKGRIFVLKGYGIGYGGKVITVASFLVNKNRVDLIAIKVIEYSQETPGLGAKIAEDISQKRFYPIPYEGLKNGVKVDKDAGKSNLSPEEAKEIGVVKISDVMTGATITPRAVASTIDTMFEFLNKEVQNNVQ